MWAKGIELLRLELLRVLVPLPSCVALYRLDFFPLLALFRSFINHCFSLYVSAILIFIFKHTHIIFFLCKVSTLVAMIGAVYLRVFLPDSNIDRNLNISTPLTSQTKLKPVKIDPFKTLPSLKDLTSLLGSRCAIFIALLSLLCLFLPFALLFHSFELSSFSFYLHMKLTFLKNIHMTV